MSVNVALLKSIRRLMRSYSERKIGKQMFLIRLGSLVCELENEYYGSKNGQTTK